MRKLITTLLLCALFFVSCDTHKVYLRSYVSAYYEVDSIYMSGMIENRIAIARYNSEIGPDYIYFVSHNSRGKDKEIYDAQCVKHNDMSYNKTVEVPSAYPVLAHEYLATDFISLSIISDSDFNSEYLAGTPLNDMILFCTVSPAPYINSGYKEYFDWDKANEIELEIRRAFPRTYAVTMSGKDPRHPTYKLVSELNSGDLTLLGTGETGKLAFLKFEQKPTLDQTHVFTMTLTADDGRVFSDTIEMTFD